MSKRRNRKKRHTPENEGQLEKRRPSFIRPEGQDAQIADILKTQLLREERVEMSGPLPPPDMLAQYKAFIPDAPERLLALVEREQQNRHQNEAAMIAAIQADALAARTAQARGDYISLVFFFSCLAAGGAVLHFGFSEALAGTLMGAPLIVAIASFLKTRFVSRHTESTQQKNGQEKAKAETQKE